jgi:phenylalanyl-tRNA synthetase alpha subunit
MKPSPAGHHCIFHQVEGLYIDKNVSFADLRQTLFFFAQEMFGRDTKIRLRPSYFPFTEPSAEMDVSCSSAVEKAVPSVNTPDGWKFWVVEWWTLTCWIA